MQQEQFRGTVHLPTQNFHRSILSQIMKSAANFNKIGIFTVFAVIAITGPMVSAADSLLSFRDADGVVRPVESQADWNKKRQQILDGMQAAMGPLPKRSDLPSLDVKIRESVDFENYVRHTISFCAAENETVPAYLYVPLRKNGGSEKKPVKTAAILALHPTGMLGKRLVDGENPMKNRAYARELARRGYIVIAPDYPSYGELADYDFKNDRYESGTMKGIFNHIRCVDLLQTREDVDPERIGVIGHSLGGHNAMFVAAFDERLKAIVSSCGWTEFENYDIGPSAINVYGGRLGPWAQDRYIPLLRDRYKLDGEQFPFQFHEVIALFAPRAFFSNSPLRDANFDVAGVDKGIAIASKAYRFLGAEENLQIRKPDAGHDFPPETRLQAYRFLDKYLKHQPTVDDCLEPHE